MNSKVLPLVILLLLRLPALSQVPGFSSSNLPIIVINTGGKAILNGSKISATMKIIYNGQGKVNTPTDAGNEYDGNIGVEIRGSYSASLPQKPYGIETRDAAGANRNVSILGMPEENDWILLANYNDKVFMRNVLAYELFRRMGHYAPRTRMVEVIVNNEYLGIYVLAEKIKQDKGRVDIAKLKTTDTSGEDITGGYIFKIDYYDQSNSWQSSYHPSDHPEKTVNYVYEDPSSADLLSVQKEYIRSAVNSFESVLYGSDFKDTAKGYASWIDVNSFIDYFIVTELSRNVDGFKKSVYFFKDKNSKGGKINAGPVWDFDWAWKNIWDCSTFSATDGSGWSYKINDCSNIWPNSNGWMVRLLQDSNFANALNKRYFDFRKSYLSNQYLNSFIDSVKNLVKEAQVRHYTKWPILGKSVGAPEVDYQPATFDGQITKFRNWIETRLIWLDRNMLGTPVTADFDILEAANSYRLFPNPAIDIVYLESQAEITSVDIVRLDGVSLFKNGKVAANLIQIDVKNFTPGIYVVRFKTNENRFFAEKLIVK